MHKVQLGVNESNTSKLDSEIYEKHTTFEEGLILSSSAAFYFRLIYKPA